VTDKHNLQRSLLRRILSNRKKMRGSLANLSCRFSIGGHRSEIMLGVLVGVFCPNYIAGLGLCSGEREIPLIVSLRVSRTPRLWPGTNGCPLLRAVSKWPRRFRAVLIRHFWPFCMAHSLVWKGNVSRPAGQVETFALRLARRVPDKAIMHDGLTTCSLVRNHVFLVCHR
jgi:hypothetical protein